MSKAKEQIKDKTRSAEILGVFAKHNFYVNGFTAEELRTTLEDLGPTYVKIGQIMSSRTDMLPEAFALIQRRPVGGADRLRRLHRACGLYGAKHGEKEIGCWNAEDFIVW